MLLLDCTEGNRTDLLTRKLLGAMRAYRESRPPRDFFMRVDDDTFVSWPRFSSWLMTNADQNSYVGMPLLDAEPCREWAHPDFEPYSVFNGTKYPPAMAAGPGFALGRELVRQVLNAGIGRSNVLWQEERAVGAWMQKVQRRGKRVDFVPVQGISGPGEWDLKHATTVWKSWAEYSHLLHHKLRGDTIACLAHAAVADNASRPIGECFAAEPNVATKNETAPCVRAHTPVDFAHYSGGGSNMSVDVTNKVNDLIAMNGMSDFTRGASLRSLLPDLTHGQGRRLRLQLGANAMTVYSRDLGGPSDLVYDVSALEANTPQVDSAFYAASRRARTAANVTDEINRLLKENTVDDATGNTELTSILEDVAPNAAKTLHVMKGDTMLNIPEVLPGGLYRTVFNLSSLFGASRSDAAVVEHPSIYIAVFSRRADFTRRQLVRDMWKEIGRRSAGFATSKFAICDNATSDGVGVRLRWEHDEHGDLLFLPCVEDYRTKAHRTEKLLAALKAYRAHHPVHDLFMKVEDDTFVSWSRFAKLLAGRAHRGVYMGLLASSAAPCRNASHPRYEPPWTFNGSEYPVSMAGGPGYTLGRSLVTQILESGVGEKRKLWNEDKAVGVWIHMLQERGTPVDFVSVPGVDLGDPACPQRSRDPWATWAEYPHAVHHGLHPETIQCLAVAEKRGAPWRPLGRCFTQEKHRRRPEACKNPKARAIVKTVRHFLHNASGDQSLSRALSMHLNATNGSAAGGPGMAKALRKPLPDHAADIKFHSRSSGTLPHTVGAMPVSRVNATSGNKSSASGVMPWYGSKHAAAARHGTAAAHSQHSAKNATQQHSQHSGHGSTAQQYLGHRSNSSAARSSPVHAGDSSQEALLQEVDYASYGNKSVTNEVNALIRSHGISNMTGSSRIVDVLGDPAPGKPKTLSLRKGLRVMDFHIDSNVFDVGPLFEAA